MQKSIKSALLLSFAIALGATVILGSIEYLWGFDALMGTLVSLFVLSILMMFRK